MNTLTQVQVGNNHENEHVTEKGSRINILIGLVPEPIFLSEFNDSSLSCLDVYHDGIFIQYEDSGEWIPLTVINHITVYYPNFIKPIPNTYSYEYPQVTHVLNKHVGIYQRDNNTITDLYSFLGNSSSDTVCYSNCSWRSFTSVIELASICK